MMIVNVKVEAKVKLKVEEKQRCRFVVGLSLAGYWLVMMLRVWDRRCQFRLLKRPYVISVMDRPRHHSQGASRAKSKLPSHSLEGTEGVRYYLIRPITFSQMVDGRW